MSNVRQEAIRAIAGAKHKLNRVDFKTTHIKELFGVNVFNEEVQRQRLPKPIFKALQKTIKQGATLDPAIADNPVYAEHWAGHRPVEVTVEEDRIVIRRAGEDGDGEGDGEDDE